MTIYCPNPECRNKLAEQRESGSWETRRRGRIVVALPGGLESITCEECGEVWTPEKQELPEQMPGRIAMPIIKRAV